MKLLCFSCFSFPIYLFTSLRQVAVSGGTLYLIFLIDRVASSETILPIVVHGSIHNTLESANSWPDKPTLNSHNPEQLNFINPEKWDFSLFIILYIYIYTHVYIYPAYNSVPLRKTQHDYF